LRESEWNPRIGIFANDLEGTNGFEVAKQNIMTFPYLLYI
jgi:hypothetical protein